MEEEKITDYIKVNKYQTPINEELKNSLSKEVFSDLLEFCESVGFIKWLISPEEIRGFAKDRERDESGKIKVDITKPHILEDMDFFRERALYHEKHGRYTHLRPNPNPKSEYTAFWKEELRRWRDGLVRPSDGEWIPGGYYFYLNYSPIWINVESSTTGGKKSRGKRSKHFPNVWQGDYLFFHYIEQARNNGAHCKLLKCRGVGFSYKLASLSPRNMYIEPGLPNFHLASDKTFLDGEKGVFGKVLDVLDWIADSTPLPKMRLVNGIRSREIQLGYQDEYGVKKGLKSSVYGISLKDNPDKARGVRGPLIHYEEDGLFPNLEKAWGVNRKAVEDGDIVYGLMLAGGTGGTENADFEGSEKLFRTPLAYNIYGIPNVFDKNSNGETVCGFFWGAYMNRAKCYDPINGESDVIKALIQVLEDRFIVKYNSSDPGVITQKLAEECITPSEAVMRTSGTIFPVSDLKDYRDSVKIQGARFFDTHYVGNLVLNQHNIEWKPDADLYPIRKFPLGTDRPEGALEIYEMPKYGVDGKIDPHRYISGIDPVDDDEAKTTSLTSIFIFDLYTDRIVAEYTGRTKFANDFYEMCRRLLIFYNAKANYENNKKGIFNYFDQKRCLNLLCETPQILRDMEYVKGSGFGNKSLGTNATLPINTWGRRLQRDYLMSKAFMQDVDADGNQVGEKLNMHTVRSMGYIDELIAWNSDINADRISAMGMLMIYREDRLKYIQQRDNKTNDDDYDEYIDKNFQNAYQGQNSYGVSASSDW